MISNNASVSHLASNRFKPYQYRQKADFYTVEWVDLPNGMTSTQKVLKFSRHCAYVTVSSQYASTIQGFNRTTDVVIVVQSKAKDPINFNLEYSAYTVKIDGISYTITMLSPDTHANARGYHMLSLRRKDSAT